MEWAKAESFAKTNQLLSIVFSSIDFHLNGSTASHFRCSHFIKWIYIFIVVYAFVLCCGLPRNHTPTLICTHILAPLFLSLIFITGLSYKFIYQLWWCYDGMMCLYVCVRACITTENFYPAMKPLPHARWIQFVKIMLYEYKRMEYEFRYIFIDENQTHEYTSIRTAGGSTTNLYFIDTTKMSSYINQLLFC